MTTSMKVKTMILNVPSNLTLEAYRWAVNDTFERVEWDDHHFAEADGE
jgi:hypothetical protein